MEAFFLADQNVLFMIMLCVFAGLSAIELFGFILGFSTMIGHNIDLNGDSVPDVDIDGDFHLVASFTNWLGLGRVPVMVFLVLFSATFGLIGLCVNHAALQILGFLLDAFVAAPIALIITLPVVAKLTHWISKILPRDESSAIELRDLLGREGIITTGTATHEKSAHAYCFDQHHNIHSFMVRSLEPSIDITEKTKVRLENLSDRGFFYVTPIN